MTFVTAPNPLSAHLYNRLLIDHAATLRAQSHGLKDKHAAGLMAILSKHELDNDLEIHLLHRHFELDDGEAIIHWHIDMQPVQSKHSTIRADVAKVLPCASITESVRPVMWYSAGNESLVPYEFAIGSRTQIADKFPAAKLATFAKEFSTFVWAIGLQDIVALKDKQCLSGGEYVAPEFRALFRVPFSLIAAEGKSEVIETGWTFREGDPHPQPTDGHMIASGKTTGGTILERHVVTTSGHDSFDPLEISPVYTDQLWAALDMPPMSI